MGATLRKGGQLGGLRRGITNQDSDDACRSQNGGITLKLFNLIRREIGETFLHEGVPIASAHLAAFLQRHQTRLADSGVTHKWAQASISFASLLKLLSTVETVELQLAANQ